jgi:outer membrane cobalamin receptor
LIRRVPGLSARRTSGSLGDGLRVSLRGSNSISLSDQPAVYLDGVRIDEGGTVDMRVLDQIPAADVQRIRVLRGPAATTLYPLSAAGVILVETRRGSPQDL